MSFSKLPVEYKEIVIREESDKAKKCEPKREQKAWIWVKYVHFYDDRCEILQIYPRIKKQVVKWED